MKYFENRGIRHAAALAYIEELKEAYRKTLKELNAKRLENLNDDETDEKSYITGIDYDKICRIQQLLAEDLDEDIKNGVITEREARRAYIEQSI